MVGVEMWAEVRRLHFAEGVSMREISRRMGIDRKTVKRMISKGEPPRYERKAVKGSLLDPYRQEIHRLLSSDPKLPGIRIYELISELGYEGKTTILQNHLREIRPCYLPCRTFQRTEYQPGEICQFDLWRPSSLIPVGSDQSREGYVVVSVLGYSRFASGALIFSRKTDDILWGMARCISSFGAIPKTLIWDREGALHSGKGKPTDEVLAFCGQLGLKVSFCQPRDPQAKGIVERLQGYLETNFEKGRRFTCNLDFQSKLDDWFKKANNRKHSSLRFVPKEKLAEELKAMRPIDSELDLCQKLILRTPPDPYLRFDTNDYSLSPLYVGKRICVRISQTEIVGKTLDEGKIVCYHKRSFAKHLTITDPEHQKQLDAQREIRRSLKKLDVEVQKRSLAVYDQLIPA